MQTQTAHQVKAFKSLRRLLWMCPLFLVATSVRAAPQSQLEHILDEVDSPTFVVSFTAPASEASTAESIALRAPEIQYLIANQSTSIPEMSKRLSSPRGLLHESTKIAYFIVFGRTKDYPLVMPVIADYLDSVPDSDKAHSDDFDNDPFQYAASAAAGLINPQSLETFTQKYKSQIKANKVSLFSLRHELAALLRAEYNHRSSSPKKQNSN